MEREEAVKKIRLLIGKDLVPLANEYSVTIWKSPGKKNKGWAGHVIEHYLGLPINVGQSPNFGSWELKVVPLKHRGKDLIVKETMAITMIDPYNVLNTPFEESHLLAKLSKMVAVARIFENVEETSSIVHSVGFFDLSDPHIYETVRQDYEETRRVIGKLGFEALTGKMGVHVQPRTKGAGHGSTSRAFYARTHFVEHIIGVRPL
ncbi:MAG: MutH/Sau3AI family endonuclease [Candidatus Eisenbacteria bacterium]|nr:MutH/Sau3AI family endonuclease [Candidatus Eisenbacteria bacterium]